MYRMKREMPRQVGKSRAKAALPFSIDRFWYFIMKISVPSRIIVAPMPIPSRKKSLYLNLI